jgi:transcriptional regulator with XRE-family HTH domain
MITQPKLGQILAKQRRSASIGLREAARIAEVSHSHLDKIEKGEVVPSANTLLKIIDATSGTDSLLAGVFEVSQVGKCQYAKLAEAIVAQVFLEAGFVIRQPRAERNTPDIRVELPGGGLIEIEVHASNADADKAHRTE